MVWAVVALAVLCVVLWSLYKRSMRESRSLANYALLLLLDEKVYTAQKSGLHQLVTSLDASGASDLGPKVNLSLSKLALSLENTILGVAGMLWQLKGQRDLNHPGT